MLEPEILYFLGERKNYDKHKAIKPGLLSSECTKLIKTIGKYFEAFPSDKSVVWTKMRGFYTLSTGEVSKDAGHLIGAVEKKQGDGDPPNPIIMQLLTMRSIGIRLYDEAYKISSGDVEDFDRVYELLSEYDEIEERMGKDSARVLGEDADGVLNEEDPKAKHGLEWRLKELNDSLGPVAKGDLIMIGGRPDSGKTTLLASEATRMAEQLPLGKVVLWFNNEERGEKVYTRIIQAALSCTRGDLYSNRKEYLERFHKVTGGPGKILVVDDDNMSVHSIQRTLEKYNPGLIVIDQLSNIKGLSAPLETEALRLVAVEARRWAKKYAPVLFTVWADGSAEGQKWISQSQVYGSKTGLPGTCDANIMLGRQVESGTSRFIHIPKNKLYGLDESKRNGRFEVLLKADEARFHSLTL